jgi:hypothetical protein
MSFAAHWFVSHGVEFRYSTLEAKVNARLYRSFLLSFARLPFVVGDRPRRSSSVITSEDGMNLSAISMT